MPNIARIHSLFVFFIITCFLSAPAVSAQTLPARAIPTQALPTAKLGAAPAVPTPVESLAPLTLSDALAVAHRGSLTIGGAQAQIAAAQARLRAASAIPGTTLTLAHAFGKNTGGFDEDVLLSQVIEIGKRGARMDEARFERDAARFDRARVGTDLDFAVRSAYYNALQGDVENKLAADALDTAHSFKTAAEAQFTAGDVPRANVLRSNIEQTRAQAAVAQAQAECSARYSALRSLLGMADDDPLHLADTLQFKAITLDLPTLQTLGLQKRADVHAAQALVNAKLSGVQIARSQNRPDAFLEARRSAISSYPDLPNGISLRVGLVIPIYDFGRNRAAVGEAKATAVEQQAAFGQVLRTARLDVTTTYLHLMAAQSAVESFTAGRLSQASELLDMTQTGYQHGANSVLELLDAQTVYRNEQADYARSLAAWNTAYADLERAVGGKLP